MKNLMTQLAALARGNKIEKFDTTYGALYAVAGSDFRLEHHFKAGAYAFAMILDADRVLFDVQL